MKNFITKLFLYLALILIIVVVGLITPKFTPHQNLYYALKDKHERLSATRLPKIILVGGSNLSFGVDSKLIEDSLHIPVINSSVHAGMGLKYIMNDIIPYVKKGDVVVLAPEYDHFYGNALWGYDPLVSSIVANPENIHLLDMHNWKDFVTTVPKQAVQNIAKGVLNVVKTVLGKSSPGVYDRDSFNERGDVVSHFDLTKESFPVNDIDDDYNPETILEINKFRTEVELRQARLFVTFPCLNKSSYDLYPQKIHFIARQLKESHFEILGTPEAYSFPDSLYFNAKYHLNRIGVKERTTSLIKDLRQSGIIRQ